MSRLSCSAKSRPSRSPPASKSILKLGSVGYITQALGGSFTVYIDGNLFRIAGQDADAIGKTAGEGPRSSARRLRRGHQERGLAAAQDLL